MSPPARMPLFMCIWPSPVSGVVNDAPRTDAALHVHLGLPVSGWVGEVAARADAALHVHLGLPVSGGVGDVAARADAALHVHLGHSGVRGYWISPPARMLLFTRIGGASDRWVGHPG